MIFQCPDLPQQYKEVVDRVRDFRKQLGFMLQQQPGRWTGLLRRSLFARAIQASNTIEGYNVTYEDAIAAMDGGEPLQANHESWLAVRGYRDAMTYILQLAEDPFYRHNEHTMKGLHFMMVGYDHTKNPGRWRPGAVYVRREPENEIVYEGPEVDIVPQLMAGLVTDLNKDSPNSPLVRAAMAHLNLVMIHPFSDGNGRMARALQTMVLAREGIIDKHFCSIEEYLGRNTAEYYAVLGEVGEGAWHPENDPIPWIKFCLTAHYRQAETLSRRMKEIARIWDGAEQEILKVGMNERVVIALVNAALGQRIRNSDYRSAAEVSDQVAGKDLRQLATAGYLIPKGERRGRYYIAGQWLIELRARSREDKIVTDPFSNEVRRIPRGMRTEEQFLPGFGPRAKPRTA